MKKKIFTILSLCVLAIIFAFTPTLSSFFQTSMTDNSVIRDVNVDSVGMLSYQEKAEKLLNEFDKYESGYSDDLITFEGELSLDISTYTGFDYLDTTNKELTKKYKTQFDAENSTFTLIAQIYDGETLLEETTDTVYPEYVEELDDYIITLDNGSKISVKDSLMIENVEECLVVAATVATVSIAAVLAVTVVAAAPTIVEVATTIVTTVITWVRSFWSWFRSLFTPKTQTVTTTTITKIATPSLEIDKTKYETKEMTNTDIKLLPVENIYLAFADPTNGLMYLSLVPIDVTIALAIISTPVTVNCIGDTNKKMIASVYTFKRKNAFALASSSTVGISSIQHDKHGALGFPHFHTNTYVRISGNKARPHVFFETPLYI